MIKLQLISCVKFKQKLKVQSAALLLFCSILSCSSQPQPGSIRKMERLHSSWL